MPFKSWGKIGSVFGRPFEYIIGAFWGAVPVPLSLPVGADLRAVNELIHE